jgi:hypothetical protein
MSENTPKKPWQSGAIVTALIGLIFGLLEYFGVFIDPELQAIVQNDDTVQKITDTQKLQGLLTVALSIGFAYFRLRARRAIEGGVDVLATPFRKIGSIFKRRKKEEQS